jgi:hypothetical protein
MTKLNVSYFERPGRHNTEATLKIALRRVEELDIGTVIVASSTGETGVKACEVFKGRKVVVVSSFTGFRRPNEQRFSPENRATVERSGGIVLTASHVFTGVSRAAYLKFGTAGVDEIVRGVLYMFGQGMKVCCDDLPGMIIPSVKCELESTAGGWSQVQEAGIPEHCGV